MQFIKIDRVLKRWYFLANLKGREGIEEEC